MPGSQRILYLTPAEMIIYQSFMIYDLPEDPTSKFRVRSKLGNGALVELFNKVKIISGIDDNEESLREYLCSVVTRFCSAGIWERVGVRKDEEELDEDLQIGVLDILYAREDVFCVEIQSRLFIETTEPIVHLFNLISQRTEPIFDSVELIEICHPCGLTNDEILYALDCLGLGFWCEDEQKWIFAPAEFSMFEIFGVSQNQSIKKFGKDRLVLELQKRLTEMQTIASLFAEFEKEKNRLRMALEAGQSFDNARYQKLRQQVEGLTLVDVEQLQAYQQTIDSLSGKVIGTSIQTSPQVQKSVMPEVRTTAKSTHVRGANKPCPIDEEMFKTWTKSRFLLYIIHVNFGQDWFWASDLFRLIKQYNFRNFRLEYYILNNIRAQTNYLEARKPTSRELSLKNKTQGNPNLHRLSNEGLMSVDAFNNNLVGSTLNVAESSFTRDKSDNSNFSLLDQLLNYLYQNFNEKPFIFRDVDKRFPNQRNTLSVLVNRNLVSSRTMSRIEKFQYGIASNRGSIYQLTERGMQRGLILSNHSSVDKQEKMDSPEDKTRKLFKKEEVLLQIYDSFNTNLFSSRDLSEVLDEELQKYSWKVMLSYLVRDKYLISRQATLEEKLKFERGHKLVNYCKVYQLTALGKTVAEELQATLEEQ